MKKILTLLPFALAMPAAVQAHHGTNGQFDSIKLVTRTGVMARRSSTMLS